LFFIDRIGILLGTVACVVGALYHGISKEHKIHVVIGAFNLHPASIVIELAME
jgi:hypothetical protein